MLYKIYAIKYANRFRGASRTDGRYPLRIGRIVDIDQRNIQIGRNLILEYKNSDGSDNNSWLMCSKIVAYHELHNGLLQIETKNSIYEFERIKY